LGIANQPWRNAIMTNITRLALVALICLHAWVTPAQGEENTPLILQTPPPPTDRLSPSDDAGSGRGAVRERQTRHDGPSRRQGAERTQHLEENPFRLDNGRRGADDPFRLDSGRKGGDDPFRLDNGRRGADDQLRIDGRDGRTDGRIRDDVRIHDRPGGSRSGDDRHRDDRSRDFDRRRGDYPAKDRHDSHDTYRYPRYDDGRRYDSGRHDRDGGRHYTVRRVVHRIPSHHAVILHGRDRFHYYEGRFYRPWNSGFILVRPPVGLVVFSLPFGSRVVVSAGITYHVFGDVYYRRVLTGYEVVEPIRAPGRDWPARVSVVTDLLNIRYGPDESEEVIAQADRYTILNVLGSAPGWLYVEIDGDDVRGWVMERYVSRNLGRG
jgi:hypothetical protein